MIGYILLGLFLCLVGALVAFLVYRQGVIKGIRLGYRYAKQQSKFKGRR